MALKTLFDFAGMRNLSGDSLHEGQLADLERGHPSILPVHAASPEYQSEMHLNKVFVLLNLKSRPAVAILVYCMQSAFVYANKSPTLEVLLFLPLHEPIL